MKHLKNHRIDLTSVLSIFSLVTLLIAPIFFSSSFAGETTVPATTNPSTISNSHSESSQWLLDIDNAMAIAKKNNKTLLVDFSGSDWCGWCMKLDKEVFSKKAFKAYVKDNFVLLLIDFPRRSKQSDAEKKQNKELAQKYQVRGFPTVLILDKDGKLLKSGGYMEGGPEAYIKYLKQVKSELK